MSRGGDEGLVEEAQERIEILEKYLAYCSYWFYEMGGDPFASQMYYKHGRINTEEAIQLRDRYWELQDE